MRALSAGDIATATQLVGCPVHSQQSISDMVLHSLNTDLEQCNQNLSTKLQKKQSLQEEIENEEAVLNRSPLEEESIQLKKNMVLKT